MGAAEYETALAATASLGSWIAPCRLRCQLHVGDATRHRFACLRDFYARDTDPSLTSCMLHSATTSCCKRGQDTSSKVALGAAMADNLGKSKVVWPHYFVRVGSHTSRSWRTWCSERRGSQSATVDCLPSLMHGTRGLPVCARARVCMLLLLLLLLPAHVLYTRNLASVHSGRGHLHSVPHLVRSTSPQSANDPSACFANPRLVHAAHADRTWRTKPRMRLGFIGYPPSFPPPTARCYRRFLGFTVAGNSCLAVLRFFAASQQGYSRMFPPVIFALSATSALTVCVMLAQQAAFVQRSAFICRHALGGRRADVARLGSRECHDE